MTIEQQGSTYRIDVTEPNMAELTKLVLERCQEVYARIQGEQPDQDGATTFAATLQEVAEAPDTIAEQVRSVCRAAMLKEPNLRSRKDLVGRVLINQVLSEQDEDHPAVLQIKEFYLRPILAAVRTIIGEDRYSFFNDMLRENLINNCVVRDLNTAVVDWNNFFDHKAVMLVLKKTAHIRRWLAEQEKGQQAFIDLVNTQIENAETPAFDSEHFSILMEAWNINVAS